MSDIDKARIAKIVRGFQLEIWNSAPIRHNTVPHALQLFDPENAAAVHGYSYEVAEGGIGTFGVGRDQFAVAGFIDAERRLIKVAGNLSYEIQRFTGAHELGHLVLHPGLKLHRDRPVSGHSVGLNQQEREANYFAACLLAPERSVFKAFAARFGKSPIYLSDDTAFALVGSQRAQELLRAPTGSRDFAVTVATAGQYGSGNRFDSLARVFGLSGAAMAIRLEELGLICS